MTTEIEYNNKLVIYQILNLINGKSYVGSATKRIHRWSCHKYLLRLNIHLNVYLQRSWNKYGEAVFKFKVIEVVLDKSKLIEREQFWLDWLKPFAPNNGYNICKIAGNSSGTIHTEETKIKIGNIHRGKIISEEQKKKIGLSKNARKINKLPCPDGSKCKCRDCTDKIKLYNREYNKTRCSPICL